MPAGKENEKGIERNQTSAFANRKKRYFCSSLPARYSRKGRSRRHGRTIIHDIRNLHSLNSDSVSYPFDRTLAACAQRDARPRLQGQEIVSSRTRGGRHGTHDRNTLSAFQASRRRLPRRDRHPRPATVRPRSSPDGSLRRDQTAAPGTVEEDRGRNPPIGDKQGNKDGVPRQAARIPRGKGGLYVEFEMKTKPEALCPEERLHA